MKKFCIIFISIITLIGCEKEPPTEPVLNIPPETHIFVEGLVDTVPARQVIHWWGNDPDGWVVGYYYNWDEGDTVFTTLTCDTFVLRAEDTVNFHTLTVWAEDNEGATDPTPAGLTIPVRNSPPTVYFKDKSLPKDTTLPVATFYLEAEDIDGNESVAGFYYRLDTDISRSFIPADIPYVTLRDITPGERTFYAWAVDESNALSDSISYTWWVEGIVSDILLVDDEPGAGARPFYRDIIESMGLTYNLWRVEDGLPYSPFDVDITINELGFNTIIWYTGDDICHLSDAQKPVERFLDDEKTLFLVSPSALNNLYFNVAIPSAFVYNYLGVDTSTLTEDYMDIVLPPGYVISRDTLVTGYPDSLMMSVPIISMFDAFETTEEAAALYRLPETGRWEGRPCVAVRHPAHNPNCVF
ncbi:MAG: hypothetical protein COT45_04315, partial [bacterium (Candidatus Stahlbacteria) CG08_land_8_20_14_0_20_40_26]